MEKNSWINLDPYLPIEELKNLHLKICSGISRSHQELGGLGWDVVADDDIRDLHYGMEILRNTDEYEEYIKDMTYGQLKEFVRLYFKTVSLGRMISLRRASDQTKLQNSSHVVDTEDQKNFPELMDLIYRMPFKEIGRIVIFINEPYMPCFIHSDVYPGEFIWFRTTLDKKFFIYDKETKAKNYITSYSAYFDPAQHHGADPNIFPSFSIRVDGPFTEEFKKKIGLSS